FLTDLIDRQLPFPQGVENRNPQRVRQGFEEFRFEVAQLLPHRTLRYSDDRSQMTARFSICASLQMLALTPTRVKPASGATDQATNAAFCSHPRFDPFRFI